MSGCRDCSCFEEWEEYGQCYIDCSNDELSEKRIDDLRPYRIKPLKCLKLIAAYRNRKLDKLPKNKWAEILVRGGTIKS